VWLASSLLNQKQARFLWRPEEDPMSRWTLTLAAVAVAVAAASTTTGAALSAPAGPDEAERIQDSLKVLRQLTATPEDRIPEHLLERAEAIVVIPSLVKGGFIVGAKHGKGVLAVRDRAAGTWSAPAFVKMTGGSIGWQIGLESVDLVLLVMNADGVEELLEDKFTLGGSASVAAGPLGRQADAATNPQFSSQILAYSRAKGLFAGATLEGASLRADDDANRDFYGAERELKQVARHVPATMPDAAMTWRTTLNLVTGTPR
jgi:lipid-binding SYLF domain-containing protein